MNNLLSHWFDTKNVTFEFEVNHEKVTVEKLEEYSKKVEIEISIDISFKLLL